MNVMSLKTSLLLLASLFLIPAGFAADSVSDIPKACYDTVDGGQFCTTDKEGDVKVFVFNAGWCGPCNQEMAALSRMAPQYEGKPVTFASLSGEGWRRGAKPDQKFLKEWKARHKIPFVVAGKFRDFGKQFGAEGGIPFAVIIDQKGDIAEKGYLEPSDIRRTVDQLLGTY
jgi:thiol-disulfide isomerase/thioredoxin